MQNIKIKKGLWKEVDITHKCDWCREVFIYNDYVVSPQVYVGTTESPYLIGPGDIFHEICLGLQIKLIEKLAKEERSVEAMGQLNMLKEGA